MNSFHAKSRDARAAGEQNIWNRQKPFALPRNLLTTTNTAEGILGKAWGFQGQNLEMFGVDLEKLAAATQPRVGQAMGWRTRRDSNPWPLPSEGNGLRFPRVT